MTKQILPEFRVGGGKDWVLAPFSLYYRRKLSIAAENVQTQAVLPFVVSSQDGKVAIVKNSKAGCTSLTHAIYTYDTGKKFIGNVHREGSHLRQGYSYWIENSALLDSEKCLRVSTVRNPQSRIISSFLDFVVEQRNPMLRYHKRDFSNFGLLNISDPGRAFDHFLDFVEESFCTNHWKTDRHWRPQVLNLWVERINYDLILRVDRLEHGFKEIRKDLNVSDAQFPFVHANKASSKKDFLPTHEQKARIQNLYKDDFELFESASL